MNKRAREILTWIMNKKEYEESCTLNELMQHFSVSERTIRYDLEGASQFLIEHHFLPISIGNGGVIQLQIKETKLRELLTDHDFYSFKLSREERVEMIQYLLLNTEETITQQAIADILFVSRSTVINDVDEARKVLETMDLDIVSLRKGLCIQGKESKKRIVLLNLLRKQFIKNYCLQEEQGTLFSIQDEMMLRRMIEDAELTSHRFLTDGAFEDIKQYLMIMIERSQKNMHVEIDYISQHVSMQMMANDIMDCMVNYFATDKLLQEEYLLADILYNLDYLKRNDTDERIMQIQVLSKQFIDAIAKKLHINLQNDFQFYQSLSNHLQSTFKDIQMTSTQDNELLREVIHKNKETVTIVHENILPLEQFVQRKITDEEIAYITIHVCAAMERNSYQGQQYRVLIVCNSGVGTSQLLLSRLKKYFQFYIEDVLPVHALAHYDVSMVDLIITTVPIEETRCESIILHPYLSDEDCILLGQKLSQLKVNNDNSGGDPAFRRVQTIIANSIQNAPLDKEEIYKAIIHDLKQFYTPNTSYGEATLCELLYDHIEIDVVCSDWEEAVKRSAERLLEDGYIKESYVSQMIKNIKKMGPYIVLAPGFALPHESPEMGGKRLGMNLIRLKEPVHFHNTDFDPVQFVCCLATIDKESHLKAMFHLMNLLQKPDFRKNIQEAKSADEIFQIIFEYESIL